MDKRTTNKKLQKKLYNIRNQKNCIPLTVKANDPGEYDGINEYRDYRPTVEHIAIRDRVGKGKKLNKQKPWYYLTKKEHITIEATRKSNKMTYENYIEAYIKQKVDKWEQKHNKPKEDDLFYKEEYPKWVGSRFTASKKAVESVIRKYITHCNKTKACGFCGGKLYFKHKKYLQKYYPAAGYTLDNSGNIGFLQKAA